MKGLIQRVSSASVTVENNIVGEIDNGILLLLGIEKNDDESAVDKLVDKLLKLRIFPDDDGKMNKNIQDSRGKILVISQFTLAADTSRGTRPGFSTAAHPELAKRLYDLFVDNLRSKFPFIETGIFAADMKVALVNDGPVTFMLEV
ncbi:D-aminoacyl-tRNA deacylase [Sessilibacter corallicola]|uniref:D-aminoacyl-tRNA deacylase n=1 Tax=Sessilibacter corallicola TaxID=2904075 RepID=UPI001E61DFB6|nr:D-aminoacyl-tRNA deacylase [Sessilibacter corallicola]